MLMKTSMTILCGVGLHSRVPSTVVNDRGELVDGFSLLTRECTDGGEFRYFQQAIQSLVLKDLVGKDVYISMT